MNHALPLLLKTAVELRDRRQILAGTADAARLQAGATLERLRQFRGECLARSPAASQRAANGQTLLDYQHFVDRLDNAIGMQDQECLRRQQRSEGAHGQLQESQRRLMAFEILLKRRADAQAARQNRRDQRDSDAFAARAFFRDSPDTPI